MQEKILVRPFLRYTLSNIERKGDITSSTFARLCFDLWALPQSARRVVRKARAGFNGSMMGTIKWKGHEWRVTKPTHDRPWRIDPYDTMNQRQLLAMLDQREGLTR